VYTKVQKNGKILIGLSIAAFLGPFTQTIYTPSLPEIGHFFHANSFMVNFTISIYTMILAASQFLIGPLSDTKGRRATLLPGLLLFMLGSFICFLSTNYVAFLIGRAIQALGISTGSVVAAAVIGDIFPPKERGRAMHLPNDALSRTCARSSFRKYDRRLLSLAMGVCHFSLRGSYCLCI
jgi:MFS transporter, DHA1 family, multidrug resistance protein